MVECAAPDQASEHKETFRIRLTRPGLAWHPEPMKLDRGLLSLLRRTAPRRVADEYCEAIASAATRNDRLTSAMVGAAQLPCNLGQVFRARQGDGEMACL
jgi:hypothetical protein